MTGIAAATAGAGVLAAGASMYSSSNASARSGEAAGVARQNQAMQNYLTQKQLEQQREMQIATQTDAEGNKLIYDPQRGWIPLLSERGLQLQAAGQAAQDVERRKYFGRGQYEDEQAAARRFESGGQARQLMDVMKNRYGAPTREGVEGANKIYGVTAATEPADLIRSGAAASQLRTGGNATGLQTGYEALDRSATQGVRTALAKPQTGAFDTAFSDWRNNALTPYKAFEASAAPPGTAPPGTGTEALSSQVAARAARPMQINPYSGLGQNQATAELLKAIGAQKDPDYGAGVTALGTTAIEYLKNRDKNKITTPGPINRTSSTQTYF